MNMFSEKFKDKGFTLIELLVVIAIIGILAGIVLVSFSGLQDRAREAEARSELAQIKRVIDILYLDTGQWPLHTTQADAGSEAASNELEDLTDERAGLLLNDSGTPFPNWNGPYTDDIPTDPWGNDYFFDADYDIDPGPGQTWAVVVGSFGPNGVGINAYDEDDIYLIIAQ